MAQGPPDERPDTSTASYARRLQHVQWWKRLINAQAPYRWNLRRQRLGRTLDIGCGVGRNLSTLDPGSVGVDHNADSVRIARANGLRALTVPEWEADDDLRRPGTFDSLLLAHVVEHMDASSALALLQTYLPYVRPGGKVFFICPQERGYASDPTHVRWTTGDDLAGLARGAGLEPGSWFSFPFPRQAGRWFTYNEFCLLAVKP